MCKVSGETMDRMLLYCEFADLAVDSYWCF